MYFLIKAFCFLSVQNRYEAEEAYSEPRGLFTFNAMSLSHSGLLITWKPGPNYTFTQNIPGLQIEIKFAVYSVVEKQNMSNQLFETPEDIYFNSEGQHKIHSLNESTLYEVVISQMISSWNNYYYTNNHVNYRIIDTVRHKTNSKRKGIPAKPDFEFIPKTLIPTYGVIKWYPCGRKANCHNQESGTHFGIIIKMPYNTMKLNELQVNKEEFYSTHLSICIRPGEIYEVVVYSVNDKDITYSDVQEIFVKPKISQVRNVKVLSLPDSSVLFSWEPPKYKLDTEHEAYIYYAHCFDVNNLEGHQMLLPESFSPSSTFTDHQLWDTTRKRIFGIKPEVTYNCIIFPCISDGVGYEYRMEYKLKIYNDELQIAKPDFNYNLKLFEGNCWSHFYWLPCGQSWDCENTQPGSNYTFQIYPEPSFRKDIPDSEVYGVFDINVEYNVTVKSSIGHTFSEPSTKLFKNCVEIRRSAP